MKIPSTLLPILGIASVFALVALQAGDDKEKDKGKGEPIIAVLEKAPEQPAKTVEKSKTDWALDLTSEQYRILREAGTERPNGKVYEEFKKHGSGTYYCAGCNAELFTSKEKFDSHCGWPSFYDPAKAKNVKYSTDYHLGYARTEVKCKVCDGHLGHVFKGEGYDTPTDKRYCINGTVLKFVPHEKDGKAAQTEKKAAKPKKTEDS